MIIIIWFPFNADLIPVLEAVETVVDTWHSLGLKLGLEKHRLDIIQNDHKEKIEECKKAMVSRWLDTDEPSWRVLVTALASKLVGKEGLARNLAEQHPMPAEE